MNFRHIKSWHWVLIVIALLVSLDWAIRRPDSRARELTEIIHRQGSQQLKNYPYQFHVLRVVGNSAVIATPRNVDVPALRMLAVLFPDVNVKDGNDPAFIALQQTLGQVQGEARQIVLAQPGISDVRWELDREWLTKHAIEVPEK